LALKIQNLKLKTSRRVTIYTLKGSVSGKKRKLIPFFKGGGKRES
jgi:hypothetical protein